MIVVNANTLSSLPIGRCGENLARKVVFDIRDLESLYGTGDVEVIYQRPGDAQPYPVAVHRDGTLVTWDVTATDTEMSDGSGKCELRYYVGETLAKSKIWRTWVEPALPTPSETAPPEPEQGWVDQIIAVGAAAKASADAAKADADRASELAAQAAEKAAQTAQDASDAAKAMEAAQTAQRLAEEAQSAAEAARTAAETAQAAAEQSATDAAGAKQDAETALKSAQDAAAAAAKVLADIRALYQEMQTWAHGVIQDVDAAGSAAVQSVQTAGDAQVQRVTDEGETQTANAKAQADSAAQSAAGAAQSAQQAEESAAVYDNVVADVTRLKQDLTGLQTVVDSKADKTELAKTNLYLDALYKLNKGQTYDVLEQESKAYLVDVPSGSHYVGIDKVGGKSVVWNQIAPTTYYLRNGIYADYSDGIISLRGTATNTYGAIADMPTVAEHYYYLRTKTIANPNSMTFKFGSLNKLDAKPIADVGKSVAWISYQVKTTIEGIGFNNVDVGNSLEGIQLQLLVFDLTQMFGAGNEPTIEEFEAMFPDDYYPYSEPIIISSQTDRVEVASADGTITQQIETGFPVLNSAGSVYDYIDLNEGKLHRRVGTVDLGGLTWIDESSSENKGQIRALGLQIIQLAGVFGGKGLTTKYKYIGNAGWNNVPNKSICWSNSPSSPFLRIRDDDYLGNIDNLISSLNGIMFYYELAEPIVTDLDIPSELADWLTVEAGGSITFHNTDDGKRLLIPNKLSFVRKLDEVTV